MDLVGDGAQGKIFRARCIADDNPNVDRGEIVALKVLHGSPGDDQADDRFKHKADILHSISHPAIVAYRDYFVWHDGEWDEARCLVTEFLEGETLDDRIKNSPGGIPWPEVESIFEQCLSGLVYARQQGIIHRDLKPSNIFLTKDSGVKCFDFDIARREGDDQASTVGWKGTFDYMAPDFVTETEFRGDEISDIYSLGVCFCQALTGTLPFPSLGEGAHIGYMNRWKSDEGRTKPSLKAGVFRALAHAKSFTTKCLQVDRAERYHSFADMLADMGRIHYRTIAHKGEDVYELRDMLGRGGFGEVFKAVRQSDNKLVAIKHLYSDRQSSRFVKEAKILQRYAHPNLVRYIDFMAVKGAGRDSQYFLVLELLDAMPQSGLRHRIKHTGRIELTEAMQLFINYLDALTFLHENARPIIHRDIKPTNLYAPPGKPEAARIFDLGVARDVSGTATSGGVPGTLDYMAPEFAKAGNVRGSPQSDIYAMGLCLYESITGQPAFPRLSRDLNTAWAEFQQRSQGGKVDFSDSVFRVFPDLHRILTKALETDPNKRYKRAADMRTELEQFADAMSRAAADVPVDGEPATMATVGLNMAAGGEGDIADQVAQIREGFDDPQEDGVHRGGTVVTRAGGAADVEELAEQIKKRRKLRGAVLLTAGVVAVGVIALVLMKRGPKPVEQPKQTVAPPAITYTRKAFVKGIPTRAYLEDLLRELNRFLRLQKDQPDNADLGKLISEIEAYWHTVPKTIEDAFNDVLSRGDEEQAGQRLALWRDLTDFAKQMGTTRKAYAERGQQMQDKIAVLVFDRQMAELTDRIPQKISNDPVIIGKADEAARDCKALASRDWPGISTEEKARRLSQIKKAEDLVTKKMLIFLDDMKKKAVTGISAGSDGMPESRDIRSWKQGFPALVALVANAYGQALTDMAQAKSGRFMQKKGQLLKLIREAKSPGALDKAVPQLASWREQADRPPAEAVTEIEKALGDKYIEMGGVCKEQARVKYESLSMSEGDVSLDVLKKLAERTPAAYGKSEVARLVPLVEKMKADAEKKIEQREKQRLAAARKEKPEPTPPPPAVVPEKKPPEKAKPPVKPVPSGPGTLRIVVRTPKTGALVFVDGKPVKSGTVSVDPSFTHEVRVEHKDYEPFKQSYRVDPGQTNTITVPPLRKTKKKRGWF